LTNAPTHSDDEANRKAMFELLKRIRDELRNIVPAGFVEVMGVDRRLKSGQRLLLAAANWGDAANSARCAWRVWLHFEWSSKRD
jgi:hypothetical protein